MTTPIKNIIMELERRRNVEEGLYREATEDTVRNYRKGKNNALVEALLLIKGYDKL